MAILTSQYAKALMRTVQNPNVKNHKQINEIMKRFISLLRKHNRLNDLESILEKIKNYRSNRDFFSGNVEIEYAKHDPSEDVRTYLKSAFPQKKFKITATPNPNLISGAKLRIEDKLLDYSAASSLHNIKQILLKTNSI
ncbi:MAG: F0F1 ATP synthase subunit delta [Patescibacteria group bacterium]|nr:F0F1 ATP synthase subunit delta [Patescibacteria group bacterium]